MSMLESLREVLAPSACLACGRPGAWPCCGSCLPSEPAGPGPWVLALDLELPLWALAPYRGALRAVVLAGKLGGQPAALAELGRRLGAALAAEGVAADLVTWVASKPAGGRPREHARFAASGVAAALGLPLVGLLGPFTGRDLGESRGGSAGRGSPRGPALRDPAARPGPVALRRLRGGRVLLVDDVVTTGATLASAAGALRRAGAASVEAAVLGVAASALAVTHPTASCPGPM